MDKEIKYRKGFKYQLAKEYNTKLDLLGYTIDTQFIKLTPIGVLLIRSGYAWDGPSGPTRDSKNSMRGSLEHDVLYQLMRMELLPQETRKYADERLEYVCREDGMGEFRANLWHFGVDRFAVGAADPKSLKEIITAP